VHRDHWQKDNYLNNILIYHLKKTQHEIIWEDHHDPAERLLHKLSNFENQFSNLPSYIKKINLRTIQFLYGIFHWSYFFYLRDRSNLSAEEFRANRLKKSFSKLDKKRELIVISRSSGGRFSSLIADELNIDFIICLGYPFKHPYKEDEPERYLHLEKLQTPMLIIQGKQDEYGGAEIKDKYPLSSSVNLLFVDSDHEFELCKQDWEKVLTKIDEIVIKKHR
jgi:hypothetical protein